MSESETAAATQRKGSLLVRSAEPADHEAIRTASFMTDAIAGYERLGYRRAPEYDATAPVRSAAHQRYVAQMCMNLAR
jgi:hypothetical protein